MQKIKSFPALVKPKRAETIVFSWITFKSRAHRDSVNAKVMKDPAIANMMKGKKMLFDSKRMAYGGFKVMVDVWTLALLRPDVVPVSQRLV